MNKEHYFDEIIDKYLFSELTKGEKKQFEEKLKMNRELQKESDLHKKVFNSLMKEDIIELKRKLERIHQSYVKNDISNIRGLFRDVQ